MFLGNQICAQRYLQPSYLLRLSRDDCRFSLSAPRKPLFRGKKRLFHFYNAARQSPPSEIGSLTPSFDDENTTIVLNPLEAQLNQSVHQSAGHIGEFLVPRLDSSYSDPSQSQARTRDETEHRCSEFLSEPAKRPRHQTLYEKVRQHKEDKKFVLREIRQRSTGPLNDWRIPFELLKANQQAYNVQRKEEISHTPSESCSRARRRIRQRRADSIERPKEWNAVTFRNYIEDLTKSSVDRLMQRQLYGGKTTHVEAVARVLESLLFQEMWRRNIVTPAACSAAMDFFYKHGMVRQAQAVFEQLENILITGELETVDVILRHKATRETLHSYTHTLGSMLCRGFKPTGRTWVTLLMGVESSEVRKLIIQEMRNMGLLEDQIVLEETVVLVIRDELSSWLLRGFDAASFLTWMDSQYGSKWLCVAAANNLLHEFGRTKEVREVIDLLHILIRRGLRPDSVTLNTLISLCMFQNDYDTVIDLLRLFRHIHHLPLDKIAHEILFKAVWRRRMYNCARVIWISACVNAVASFRMQNLVSHSVRESTLGRSENKPGSHGQIWKASAGPVVVGVGPSDLLDQMLAWTATSSNSGAGEAISRGQTQRSIAALIQEDLATAGRYRLVRNFADLLSDALARDRIWWQTKAFKTQDVAWKRENALVVEVVLNPAAKKKGDSEPPCDVEIPGKPIDRTEMAELTYIKPEGDQNDLSMRLVWRKV